MMKILVVQTPRGNRFLWTDQHSNEHTASKIYTHPNCQFEKFEVYRDGVLLTPKGQIRWRKRGAGMPLVFFFDLGPFGNEELKLDATQFEAGDEITISSAEGKQPHPNFGEVYWFSMVGPFHKDSLYKESTRQE